MVKETEDRRRQTKEVKKKTEDERERKKRETEEKVGWKVKEERCERGKGSVPVLESYCMTPFHQYCSLSASLSVCLCDSLSPSATHTNTHFYTKHLLVSLWRLTSLSRGKKMELIRLDV